MSSPVVAWWRVLNLHAHLNRLETILQLTSQFPVCRFKTQLNSRLQAGGRLNSTLCYSSLDNLSKAYLLTDSIH
jgi:uncharacterized ferritin-like protein (DUF455 family)